MLYDNTSGGTGRTDATFDNYLALPEEPPRLSIQWFPEVGWLQVSWPISFTGYILESTLALPASESDWIEQLDVWPEGSIYTHVELPSPGTKFFRLKKPLPALGR